MFDVIIILWAAGLGLLLGGAMARSTSRKVRRQARARAERMVEEAKQGSAVMLRDTEAQAREQALKLRKQGEERVRQATEDNAQLEERIVRLTDRVERGEVSVAVKEQSQQKRFKAAAATKKEAAARRRQARDKREEADRVLEERAGETAEQLRDHQVEQVVERHRAEAGDRLRNLESAQTEELSRHAKKLMGVAIGRYRVTVTTERTSFVIKLSADQAGKINKNKDLLPMVEECTGVGVTPNDAGDALRMESSDGVARELCRRFVPLLLGDPPLDDPKQRADALAQKLDRELQKTGKKAFKILGLKPAHPEIVELVGRLYYRTSYSQNQWGHAIEAAFLAGLMAAEMGLDLHMARRATLLHDIGKALTHAVEGSHAVIGAELARKHGEPEEVANGIGSHHNDEPPTSPYAYLVAAADAISGARPGARREIVEAYVDRLGDLERIANAVPGVAVAHAVQAGRELRVHVDERRMSDDQTGQVADRIAEQISDELIFPGQIKVIVIREFKATEVAR